MIGAPQYRTFRAVLSRDLRLSLTYRPWVINRFVGPIVWVTLAIYGYVGIASPQSIQQGFDRYVRSESFTGFLILGQTVFSLFTAMNWTGGMAVERERYYGTLEILLLTPISRTAFVLGEAAFGLVDSGWMVFMAMVVASFLFGVTFHVGSIPLVLVTMALTFLAMVALGLFLAGFYVLTRSAGPLALAFQAPLRFFTGAAFPVEALPTALQYVSFAIPITYGLRAVRGLLLAGGDLASVAPELTVLTVFTLVFLALGILFIRRMERLAKERGTIHTY